MRFPTLLLATALVLVGTGSAYAQARPILDPTACPVLVPAPSVMPPVTFDAVDRYFRVGGIPALTLSTNSIADNVMADWDELIANAAPNEQILRIHVVNGQFFQHDFAGQVNCAWVQMWDDVFHRAEMAGLYVMPVFGAWDDWNSVEAAQPWANSLYNAANTLRAQCADPADTTCLAATPDQLLDVTTAGGTGQTWLAWVDALVRRWESRPNIVAWEVFSEVNKIENATLPAATAFLNAARTTIRAADNAARPVTASLSGIDGCEVDLMTGIDWDGLVGTDLDFVQVHVYAGFPPYEGDLDRMVIDRVRAGCHTRPVFIGESGLDGLLREGNAAARLLIEPGARTGVNHAIWAGAVSGAMNGRALWFEDGYDRYQYVKYGVTDLCGLSQFAASAGCTDGTPTLTLRELHAHAAAPVKAFVAGVDFTGFAPVTLTYDGAVLYGAALGNTQMVLGWIRDAASSAATQWAPTADLSGQTVTIDLPGVSADWIVDYYDPRDPTGTIVLSQDVDQDPASGDVTLTLPDFNASIAFKIYAVGPLSADIDIRPGTASNIIRTLRPQGFQIAVVDGAELDVASIDVTTLAFGPAGVAPIRVRRLNTDGLPGADVLLLRFPQDQTGLTCLDVEGVLTGETTTGRSFEGRDVVTVEPCP